MLGINYCTVKAENQLVILEDYRILTDNFLILFFPG